MSRLFLTICFARYIWLFPILIMMTGCVSIGRGVAEAMLEKTENEDLRICQVWGRPFAGIDAELDSDPLNTKVLFVHGVGDHIPGYTVQFLEKLAKQLKLNARSEEQKNIELSSPQLPGINLGNLRVTHLLNETKLRELTFYELTWSDISRPEKALLTFDNSGEYEFRRAEMNRVLKKFSNDAGADPIIYFGKNHETILAAFAQSFCWMASGDWESLPGEGKHVCGNLNDASAGVIAKDNYVVISHSLGSRIVMDGMHRIAVKLAAYDKLTLQQRKFTLSTKALTALQQKHIPVFMLSNQLPMLQLGRELPEIAGQESSYCKPSGANYNRRFINQMDIIAFSDPNDLLSYEIPPGYTKKYIDSRLCPKITNVCINIAKVLDAFGLSNLANPMEAHVGYDQDDRVIGIIAKGIGTENSSPLVKKRCEFTKVLD
ncbi:hypothetical protein MCAMS1_02520 [biofilm metagenome]